MVESKSENKMIRRCQIRITDRKPRMPIYKGFRGFFMPVGSISFDGVFFYALIPKNFSISSSTVPIPAMPKFSIKTFATFGLRNAGSVGPRWIFFTPRYKKSKKNDNCFLLVPCDIIDNWQIVNIVKPKDLFEFQGDYSKGIGIIALTCIQNTWDAIDIA